MRLRVPTLLLVTTGLVGAAALTNDFAGWVERTATPSVAGTPVRAVSLISPVSPAEASEADTAAPASAASTPAAPVHKKVSANMICREAAWPYVQRRCETPTEREGQTARHVRIISLDQDAPRNVVAPTGAIKKAERIDAAQPKVAADPEAAAISAPVTAQNSLQATEAVTEAKLAVTTLPPARPDLSEAPAAEAGSPEVASVAAKPTEPHTIVENVPAAVPDTTAAAAADPVTHAKPAARHHVRTARRTVHDTERRYGRYNDEDSIDPGYDPRPAYDPRAAVRTTVTYGYRDPDGRQYYYRDGAQGRRQALAYRDYPPPPPGYAYVHRRSLGESLFGWLSDD